MELNSFIIEAEEELLHPEHVLRAWTNGVRTIKELLLPGAERALKLAENTSQLQEILVKKLISFSWSARAFYNAIEECYPALSQDEQQLRVRKALMKTLQSAMNSVEIHRVKNNEILQSVDLI